MGIAPRYPEHCPSCGYLGQYNKYDLYFCTNEVTVIARWSLQILNNLAESLGLGPRAQETLARLEKTTTRNLTKMIKRSQS